MAGMQREGSDIEISPVLLLQSVSPGGTVLHIPLHALYVRRAQSSEPAKRESWFSWGLEVNPALCCPKGSSRAGETDLVCADLQSYTQQCVKQSFPKALADKAAARGWSIIVWFLR